MQPQPPVADPAAPAAGDPPAPAAAPAADRTFTQADVDRIVQDRVARVKSEPPADYEELKARAAKLDEIEEQNKTELQKAQDRATELERQAADSAGRAREAQLRAAVVAEAARKNVIDPDAAFALLDRTSLVLDDEGRPTNIAEAMESLLKAKPYLAGGGRAGSADLGARTASTRPDQLSRDQLQGMSPEAVIKAQDEGRLDDLLQAK